MTVFMWYWPWGYPLRKNCFLWKILIVCGLSDSWDWGAEPFTSSQLRGFLKLFTPAQCNKTQTLRRETLLLVEVNILQSISERRKQQFSLKRCDVAQFLFLTNQKSCTFWLHCILCNLTWWWIIHKRGKHSSKMGTVCLEAVRASVSVATTRCLPAHKLSMSTMITTRCH